MRTVCSVFLITYLSCVPALADAPFFELDGKSGFYGSSGVPDDAFKLLQNVTKDGLWLWDEGSQSGSRAGQFGSVVSQFPDGIDAVLLVNCIPPVDIENLVEKAWRESGE